MGFFEDEEFEKAVSAPVNAATKVLGGFFEAIVDLKEVVVVQAEKLPSKGSIEFDKKQREEVDRQKLFYQALKEEKLSEEEINDIVSNLPTEEKNRLLHYQAGYRDKSVYQRAELRRKLIEQKKQAEEKEKQQTVKSPAKQVNAMDTAFEGGSGKSGSGSANFSSTGGGAG